VSRSIIGKLVAKDLRIAAPLVIGSFAIGLLSLAVLPWSRLAFFVGGVAFMVVLVLMNVLVVTMSLVGERKEKIRLFVLSLPVSTMQYNVAKLLSSMIAYVVPAVVLTAVAVVLFDVTALPNGFIPFTIALSVHCFLYFCVFLAFALVTDSQGWMTTVIVAGNVSLTFIINFLFILPSVKGNLDGPIAIWGPDLFAFIGIELALCAAALAISFIVYSRKTEFV
jgi:ABC-2 type transport system permease protein